MAWLVIPNPVIIEFPHLDSPRVMAARLIWLLLSHSQRREDGKNEVGRDQGTGADAWNILKCAALERGCRDSCESEDKINSKEI